MPQGSLTAAFNVMAPIQEIIEAGRALWEEGLVTSHGGNISVRVSEDHLIITKTGTKLGFLKDEDLIQIPIGSTKEEYPQASSELIVHSEIYKGVFDAKAVVHAHPFFTVLLSLKLKEIIPLDVEGRLTFKVCPVVEVGKPHASEELAKAVSSYLEKHPVVCVKGHGTFARGRNLDEALFYTSSVEFSSKLIFYTKKALL